MNIEKKTSSYIIFIIISTMLNIIFLGYFVYKSIFQDIAFVLLLCMISGILFYVYMSNILQSYLNYSDREITKEIGRLIDSYACNKNGDQKIIFDIVPEINKIENVSKSMLLQECNTKTILNILQNKYMTLINYDRYFLLNKGFYSDAYNNSKEVKVLGITLKTFIDALFSENQNHTIVDQLLNNRLIVEILLLNPKSSYVKILDEQARTNYSPNPVSEKIGKVIHAIKKYSEKDSEKVTKDNNRLEIRLIDESITMTFSCIKKNSDVENFLLLGFLFGHKEGGPLYKVPNNETDELNREIVEYFDSLFKKSKPIFSWDNKGKKYSNLF